MTITAAQVKELREKTGVGMMECKKALSENSGDMEKAIVWLRERGMSRAAKKASRTAAEGIVEVAINDTQNAGVVLEVNCETDFAGKNDDFRQFVTTAAAVALDKRVPSIEALAETMMPNGENVGTNLTNLIAKVGENMKLRRVSILETSNGVVTGYTHMGGKIGTLVCLSGDSSAQAVEIGKDLAMHVAAAAPRYLTSDQVNPTELEQEREIARKKLAEEGKPDDLIEKILTGQMTKFFKEVCLVDQAFIKDPNLSVSKYLKQSGLPLKAEGFVRFALGEGIEKKEENFAAEVAATVKGTN